MKHSAAGNVAHVEIPHKHRRFQGRQKEERKKKARRNEFVAPDNNSQVVEFRDGG
jgi:hypothetical protein